MPPGCNAPCLACGFLVLPDAKIVIPSGTPSYWSRLVFCRLGFRWDQTSSQYVDMIFDMLSSMRYFED